MSKIDLNVLADLVKVRAYPEIHAFFLEHGLFSLGYNGFVKAKERPRSGKGGRMFTPPATRKFEKEVQDWAKRMWDGPPLRYPIRVDLIIREQTDDMFLVSMSEARLVYNQKGDVDNLGKSILDGMNGIVYKDDKQICDLRVSRVWHQEGGFDLRIERRGLTPMEYKNLTKRLK